MEYHQSGSFITHLVYWLCCHWSMPCHMVRFIWMLFHALWRHRASVAELLPGRATVQQLMPCDVNDPALWRHSVTTIYILCVMCFEWNAYMVCYKTDVDWPYLGNSCIRLFAPSGMLIAPNQSISLGRCPREIDWFGAINMPSRETDVCCCPHGQSTFVYCRPLFQVT